MAGVPVERSQIPTFQDSEAERQAKVRSGIRLRRSPGFLYGLRRHRCEPRGQRDGVRIPAPEDPLDRADPETAEALCPKDYPYGTKRPCLDTTTTRRFNLPHVA